MHNIDFQNGFIVGMATRGLTKSITFADGASLKGHIIVNGSRGVWPLVLKDGFWKAYRAPTSALYTLENGPYIGIYKLNVDSHKNKSSYIVNNLYGHYMTLSWGQAKSSYSLYSS